MTQQRRDPRPFTGRHIAIIFVAFFSVVIVVNVTMARLASSTFGGVVVENSYVASQRFNRWLDEARTEGALGWTAETRRGTTGEAVVHVADSRGAALAGARVTAVAEHPLGRRPEQALVLSERAPGTYAAALGEGRWRLRILVESDGRTWRTLGDVQ